VLRAVEQLAANPARGKKLGGVAIGQWRVRVADYRIRYDIKGSEVLLYRVRDRKDIYRE
jgi:mRNA-degrading endonuclease RelE of RelBE toxin-antitoxin system